MFSIQLKNVACHCDGTNEVLPSRTACDRGLRQRLGVDVPLIGEERLQHGAGTVAVRHDVRCRLDLVEETSGFQPFDDFLPRREAVEAVQRQRFLETRSDGGTPWRNSALSLRSSRPSMSSTLIERQIMPPADLEIVEVVRRRDLHGAGALFRIGVVVADDRECGGRPAAGSPSCRSGA